MDDNGIRRSTYADSTGRTAVKAPPHMSNIKFDMALPEAQIAQGRALRDGAPVWISASTHEGEEEAALAAHQQVLKTLTQAR